MKFIRNYLIGREQRVLVGSGISGTKPVLSGVPQGSIIGPILFILFVNDLPDCLNTNTELALYADDTKIWRPIKSYTDHLSLQNDINNLNRWALENKMKFHFQKCKIVSIFNRKSPTGMLPIPFLKFQYFLGDDPLDYADSEKDLGVCMSINFRFDDHWDKILSKAAQQLGITRRTCSFVHDTRRRRALYIALIRSQFEHCSPIWRPTNKTAIDRFEAFQKKCIKWVISEENVNYISFGDYLKKCKQLNLLPLAMHFDLNDLILFHKVVYELIPLKMPEYLTLYNNNSRLRSTHLDSLSYVSAILPRNSNRGILDKSFFYRTHSLWNHVPLEIREIPNPAAFKSNLVANYWKEITLTISSDNNASSSDFYLMDND